MCSTCAIAIGYFRLIETPSVFLDLEDLVDNLGLAAREKFAVWKTKTGVALKKVAEQGMID